MKQKIFNRLLGRFSTLANFIPSSFFYFGLPRFINIEISACCQWQCLGCPSNTFQDRPLLMDQNCFTRIVEQLQRMKINCPIYLFNQGEPLLNPNFSSFCRQLKKVGFKKVIIDTNLMAMKTDEELAQLLELGLFQINIAYDWKSVGFRKGADWALLEEKIWRLVALKKQQNCSTLLVLNVVVGKHNLKSVQHIHDRAKHLGVDQVMFRTLSLTSISDPQSIALANEPALQQSGHCSFSFWGLSILSHGRASLCCLKNTAVNLNTDIVRLKEEWSGGAWRQMRKMAFIKNGVCSGCNSGKYRSFLDAEDLRRLSASIENA